jgi:type III secretion system needle length determinant
MSDRVSANRPSTPTPAMSNLSATSAPADSPGLDQAAAEFASLLGADEQSRTETKTETASPESTKETKEGESPRTEHDRVERQPERGKDSHGEGGGGHAGGASGGDSQTDTGAEPVVEMVALGDLILQGMTQKADVSGVAPTAETAATFGPVQLDNIVQQVADRILVTPPGVGGQQEVRIMIKDSILPGTEVRITQHAGQMQISLVTDSARSHDLLTQHQAALQERLTEKLGKDTVVVNVKMDSQGQPDRDGRSRNQRDIEAELRENAE